MVKDASHVTIELNMNSNTLHAKNYLSRTSIIKLQHRFYAVVQIKGGICGGHP